MGSERPLPRLLYVSAYPPSNASGAASILLNLLRDYPADRLEMLTGPGEAHPTAAGWSRRTVVVPSLGVIRRAVGRVRPRSGSRERVSDDASTASDVPAEGRSERRQRISWKVDNLLVTVAVPWIAFAAMRQIRRGERGAILAVGDPYFVTASYLAHRATGVPLFVYLTDEWRENASYDSWLHERFVTWAWPRVAKGARHLWGISPAMTSAWNEELGVRATPLWHSVDVAAYRSAERSMSAQRELDVVVLGNIYELNAGPLRRLLTAVQELRDDGSSSGVKLYTLQSRDEIVRVAMDLPEWCTVEPVSSDDVPDRLVRAEVLFLGLSFDRRWRHVVDLAFPTKLAEYLAAGRAIVVHAPPESTAVRYVVENRCGLTVTTPEVAPLVDALRFASSDAIDVDQLAQNAREVALANHDRGQVVGRFFDILRGSES
jgi:glycosyltransferase involved in cell wall biosynthesis